ncbi:hypothetical protein H8Z62_06575, partial [Mycobacterium avium subsp. hominissuis]|nr:hypothetical protein [Mycobacterium avium subsp. hominissuis]
QSHTRTRDRSYTTPRDVTLGNQLAVLYEGAAALSTSLNDPSPWAHARAAAHTLIDRAASRDDGD